MSDDRGPQWPTDITKGAAAEWRRERDARGKPPDRDDHARALWRDARTPELRAHLRKIYPHLFGDQPRRQESACVDIRRPDRFDSWPSAKQNAWWDEAIRLMAAQEGGRP